MLDVTPPVSLKRRVQWALGCIVVGSVGLGLASRVDMRLVPVLAVVLMGVLALVLTPLLAHDAPPSVPTHAAPIDFERLASVAYRTNNAVIFTDVRRRIVWVNEGFTKLTGFGFDEALGRNPGVLLQFAKTDPEVIAGIRAALDAGRDYSGELLNRARDGREYWVALEIQPLHGSGGELTGYMAVETDVTALHRATEQAESASRAKAEFLATMSHEFRTPLNGVLGFSGLLLETPLDALQRESVTTIKSAGEELLAVLNDVLDYSNLEAGLVRLEPRPFDLAGCVREVVARLAPQAERLGLTLRSQGLEGLPAGLVADADRVRQVLFNLTANAVKFTTKGSITIELAATGEGQARSVRVGVRDTGIGVPAEKQWQLFRPFTQGDSTSVRTRGGTGLGLALSRRVVALLGGEMGFSSEEGKGSWFWFSFPLVEGALPVQSPEVPLGPSLVLPPLADGAKRRVLVAEDNLVNQRLVRALLEKLGCEVELAADGRQAIARFFAANFDLVLMDLHMPVIDGAEATRAIRKLEQAGVKPRRTPIVALTASSVASEHEKCLKSGMDGVLTKPVSPAQLAAVLCPPAGALAA